MSEFRYTAVNVGGGRVSGTLSAPSEQAAIAELETRSLTPVSVTERGSRPQIRRGVGARKLATAYQQLADLLHAGVPLLRSLKLLGGRKSQPRVSEVFRQLAEAVEDGEQLADAMAKREDVFPPVQVAMVRAGEKGGFLEEVLARLAQLVQGQAELRAKVVGNMIYPTALVVVGLSLLTGVFTIFVPMFEPLYARIEEAGRMPGISTFVFNVANAFTTYAPITFLVLGVLAVTLWRLSKRPDVKRALTLARLRMPVIGPLMGSLATARFGRLLGTMLANGVPMLQAMQIAKQAAGNVIMEEAIDKAGEAVRAGESLAPPLAESGLFADDVVEMISVAESANNLDDVLITMADTVERRIDRQLMAAVKLIEPIMILLIAGALGVVAIGLILPMSQLSAVQ